jgi:hypothetical protein
MCHAFTKTVSPKICIVSICKWSNVTIVYEIQPNENVFKKDRNFIPM